MTGIERQASVGSIVEQLHSTPVQLPEVITNAIKEQRVTQVELISPAESQGIQQFVDRAVDAIVQVVTLVYREGKITEQAYSETIDGIVLWIRDGKGHGAIHSAFVYMASLQIRESEHRIDPSRGYDRVSDHDLFVRAVLHDMAEFLPYITIHGTVDATKNERRSQDHAINMAYAISRFAPILGMSRDETDSLRYDIAMHDYSYTRPTQSESQEIQSHLSLAGRIHADADRFGGAGEMYDQYIVIAEAKRNRSMSLGQWYIKNVQLSAGDRHSWQMRTKGFFDGQSAMFSAFLAFPLYLANTQTGRRIVTQRRDSFAQQFISFYLHEYRNSQIVVEAWEKSRDSIEFGIKDDTKPNGIYPLADEQASRIRELPFLEAMRQLVRVPIQSKGKRGERDYYGYSIRMNGNWYDPSILVFENEDMLIKDFLGTITAYQEILERNDYL